MQQFFDRAWHRWLKQPYHLSKPFDLGSGVPVVLLHGLGSSSKSWRHLVAAIPSKPFRVLAFDLLGFGASPKPEWLRYSVDDHANAAIKALKRARLKQPVVLVGHSMGCLVAVRVARLRPDLARHLILYEMPLYSGLPDKRRYRLRLNVYFRLYERIIAYKPIFSGPGAGKAQRIAQRFGGFQFSPDTWKPFVRSLKHTIMEQTTADDIKHIAVPMDVIYGTRDRVVIRGKTQVIFGKDATNITAHTVRASHDISKKASRFLATRIEAATLPAPKS